MAKRVPLVPGAECSFWTVAMAILSIVIAGAACYSNSFDGPFVFDDIGAIDKNESIQNLSKIWTVLTGATHCTVIGRPLLNLSLALNYQFSGAKLVWDYHAFNLAAHLFAALMLFAVAHRTLALPDVPERTRRKAVGLAFAIALIWTVHPLQTESVTYIVQRAESLVAAFFFLTLYCVIRGATAVHLNFWYFAAVAVCALGMSTKEVMATAPLVILLYDRIFLSHSLIEIRRLRSGLYAGLAATWVWLAVLMLSSQGRSSTGGFGLGISAWDYAMTQFGFIVRYLRLCFVPYPLVFDYGHPVARTPMEIIPYAAIVFCLLFSVVVALRYYPRVGFLGLSFFLILAPTSSIVPLVTQTAAEHRMYLPLAPLVAMFVVFGSQILDWIVIQSTRAEGDNSEISQTPQFVLLILIATSLGYLTYQRNKDYDSELTLWEQTVRHCPTNARAFHNLGWAYLEKGQISSAIEAFNRAIELHPDVIHSLHCRGDAYILAKQYEFAVQDYQRAASLSPTGSFEKAKEYFYVGNALGFMGKHQEALEYFRLALETHADYPEARLMIAKVKQHLRDAANDGLPGNAAP